MKTTHLALLTGLFLGIVFTFDSFAGLVLVAPCGLVGWGVSLYLENRVDVRNLLDR